MTHSSSDNVLFGVHVFVYFLQFLLLLVFTFISLSIYILEEIISPKKLVGLALYHITWSILERVPWAPEKSMYYAIFMGDNLYVSVKPI